MTTDGEEKNASQVQTIDQRDKRIKAAREGQDKGESLALGDAVRQYYKDTVYGMLRSVLTCMAPTK